MLESKTETADRHHEAILGLERRLEREEGRGKDMTVARLALMQHYAAYAVMMVKKNGGNVGELRHLTDRNNIIPLGGYSGAYD